MKRMIEFFKMVSDETRLRILLLLKSDRLCVCQLSGILQLAQPKVSKHLTKLKDSGFVIDERVDQYVFYRLDEREDFVRPWVQTIAKTVESDDVPCRDQLRLAEKQKYIQSTKE